jgi:hypothetical protein
MSSAIMTSMVEIRRMVDRGNTLRKMRLTFNTLNPVVKTRRMVNGREERGLRSYIVVQAARRRHTRSGRAKPFRVIPWSSSLQSNISTIAETFLLP